MLCERCSSPHDGKFGSGRFCSIKCARGFSTSAKRDEINKKVSSKFKGKIGWGKPFAKGDGRPRGGGRAWTRIEDDVLKHYHIKKPCTCTYCGKIWHRTYGSKGLYCSQKCQHAFIWKSKLAKIKANEIVTCGAVRRYLVEKDYSCSECKISEWQGQQVSLQIHHIDGNSANNILSNCCLLCPNCHSLTHNWCAKNKSKAAPNQSPRSVYHRGWYNRNKRQKDTSS